MGEINLCNSVGRDATVATESVTRQRRVRWLDEEGRQASSARLLKMPIECGIEALQEDHGDLQAVAEALIAGDPEIDMENTGRFLTETSRVYVDGHRKIIHKVRFEEVIKNPDGSERQRRPRKLLEPNLSGDVPLRWSGKFIQKDEACRKFVFSSKVQLHHINGLTYDFLFAIAKELEERDSLLLLGAGMKSNQPLILRRGGTPYRGFLEGRTDGDRYALILHYSNLELKVPEEQE